MRRAAVVLVFVFGVLAGGGIAQAQPPMVERKVEVLQHKPSGFWTSNRPATNGAYRYRLLGIGLVLLAGTGLIMLRMVRRAAADRLARDARAVGDTAK